MALPCQLLICWLAWTSERGKFLPFFSLSRFLLLLLCLFAVYTCHLLAGWYLTMDVCVHPEICAKQITHIQSCVIQFHYFNSPGQHNDQNDPGWWKGSNMVNNEANKQHIVLVDTQKIASWVHLLVGGRFGSSSNGLDTHWTTPNWFGWNFSGKTKRQQNISSHSVFKRMPFYACREKKLEN